MTLPIDRTTLIAAQTNQVPNALIQSAKNIAAIQTPYDTIDELYAFAVGLISQGTLSRLGVINVKDYNASGSALAFSGGITSGLKVLTLVGPVNFDFAVGQGISIAGAGAAGVTLITTVASLNGTVITTTDAASTTVSAAVVRHNDDVQIRAAIDVGASSGNTVIVPAGTYNITSSVIIKGNFDGKDATFNIYETPTYAVEISTGNAANPTTELTEKIIYLPKIVNMTKPGTGWASQGTGARLVNTTKCNIYIKNINNFAVGSLLTSFGIGNVENNIFIQSLENNKVNMEIMPGNVTAWVNENNFFGGHFQHYSGEGTGVSGTRHIQIKMFSSLGTVPNNNIFYKPCIEGSVCEYNFECEGSANVIMFGRWESTIPKVLYNSLTSSSAHDNVIFYGYNSQSIVFTNTGISTLGNHQYASHIGAKIGLNEPQMMRNYGSSANPIFMFFASGTDISNKDDTATDFTGRIGANTWSGKKDTDTNDRWRLDSQNGRLYLNNGTATPTGYIGAYGTEIAVRGKTFNLPDMTYLQPLGLGAAGALWLDTVGNVRFKTTAPASDTAGNPLSQFVVVPATATSTGLVGNWSADASYLYVCHATNTWKRVAIATW